MKALNTQDLFKLTLRKATWKKFVF